LAFDCDNTEEGVLTSTGEYVQSRECFRKEWVRYRSIEDCPDRSRCIPDVCFSGGTDKEGRDGSI
jgi:hypothetical protein